MTNFFKFVFFIVLFAVVITSCKTQTQKSKQYNQEDFVGKFYEKQNDKTPAIYGGVPFLLFETANEVHVKVSDMVEIGTYHIQENKIIIKASLYSETFEIVDDKTLKEKNGIWKLKEN